MLSPDISRRRFLTLFAGGTLAALAGCTPAAQAAGERTRKAQQTVYDCDTVQPKNQPQYPFTQVELRWVKTVFPDQAEAMDQTQQPYVVEGINHFAQKIKEYQARFIPVTYSSVIEDRVITLPHSLAVYRQGNGIYVGSDAIASMITNRQALGYRDGGIWRQYMFPYFSNTDKFLGSFTPWPGLGTGGEPNIGASITHLPWRFLTADYRDQTQIIMSMIHEAWRGLGGPDNPDPNSILHVGAIPDTAIPTPVDVEGICIKGNSTPTPAKFRTLLPSVIK